MPFRNACFVSYRHGQYDLLKEFTADFYAALLSEIEPMLGGNAVYMDRERLKGGDFYNGALARNLYESATMVMLYTPTYFDAENSYCTREYRAMLTLEAQRLGRLGLLVENSHGLIIPVVLRGANSLPEEIRRCRQYYNFESFQLGGRHLSRHPRFAPAIREIANYICDRYEELRKLPDDAFRASDDYCLPEEDEVAAPAAVAAKFRLPFPRGGEACFPNAALSAGS